MLARELTHVVHVVDAAGEEDEVIVLYLRIAPRDDGLEVALYGYDVVVLLRPGLQLAEAMQRLAHDGRPSTYLDTDECQRTVEEHHVLPRPGIASDGSDLLGSQLLGIDEPVDAELLHQCAIFALEIGVVIDTRDGALGPDALGEHGGHDIGRLVGRHSDEEIRPLDVCALEILQQCGASLDGEHLEVMGRALQLLGVGVHEVDVLLLVGEHLRQMRPYLTSACYDNPHGYSALARSSGSSSRAAR